MAHDSLHCGVNGRSLDDNRDPRNQPVDSGPWGQARLVDYKPGVLNQSSGSVSIVKGRIDITQARGEPRLRTFTISVQNRTQQDDSVGNNDRDQVADVHLVASVIYGIGGAQHQAEISVRDGTSFCVPAEAWEVSTYIEPMPDMSDADPTVLYPNASTGPKRVFVYCSCALGTRQGGATLPTRNEYWRMPTAEVNPSRRFRIPQSAISVSFLRNNVAHALTDFSGVWLGHDDGPIGLVDMTGSNPIPPGAYALDLVGPALSDSTFLLNVSWGIFL